VNYNSGAKYRDLTDSTQQNVCPFIFLATHHKCTGE